MIDALIVSNLLLWLFVCVLGVIVLALTRQIGLLHERIAPVGALAVERGPIVGDSIPKLIPENLDGESIQIGGHDRINDRTLLFFLSPTCPVCATLLPTLQRLVRSQADPTRLLFASDGRRAEHEAFCQRKGLSPANYILSRELGMHFEVSKLPYAVLIDGSGILRAKGLVNTREHVESLFEADLMGVGSLQQYLIDRSSIDDGTSLRKDSSK